MTHRGGRHQTENRPDFDSDSDIDPEAGDQNANRWVAFDPVARDLRDRDQVSSPAVSEIRPHQPLVNHRLTLVMLQVYDLCMRTNIDLDDGLLAEAFRFSANRSKKELVHEALAAYVAAKQDERRRLSYKERLLKVRAETERLRVRPGAHDIVRHDRDTR